MLLLPVARAERIPFAGIGFAAVVALVPGVWVFRTLAGLWELSDRPSAALLDAVVTDGFTAAAVVAAMAIGLALPMHLYAGISARRGR